MREAAEIDETKVEGEKHTAANQPDHDQGDLRTTQFN